MFEQLHDNRITALYCRLSRDDGFYEDSCSIVSQKSLLEKYAKEQGFDNCQFFVDDGYTGTNYDRPDFQRLIRLVDSGNIGIIVVKDLYEVGFLPLFGADNWLQKHIAKVLHSHGKGSLIM